MKKAIIQKLKLYKFGITLYKNEEVFIIERDNRFFATKDEKGTVQLGVDRKDFKYKDEPEQYKIDT